MANDIDIACQQVLQQDASVYSLQRLVIPPEYADRLTPEHLLERYLVHIRGFTGTLVRPTRAHGRLEFRLAGCRIALLSFTESPLKTEGTACCLALRICGGLLVQTGECDRGELTFTCRPSDQGLEVTLLLSDYCPLLLGDPNPRRWRKHLYRWTQAYIHKVVTIKFLGRLYRELTGKRGCSRVVKIQVAQGEDI